MKITPQLSADPLLAPLWNIGEPADAAPLDEGDLDEYAYTLAVQAYVYGFPFIYLTQVCWLWTSPAGHKITNPDGSAESGVPWAPLNTFWHAKKLASSSSSSVGGSPNADTLYSTAWCDLSHGPLVLSVPAVKDRYYTIEMTGIDSDTFGYVGLRATGSDAGNYLIAGPDWNGVIHQKPGNPVLDVLPRAGYPVILLLGRTGVNNYTDTELDKARAVQSQYVLTPLSEWEGRPVPPVKAQVPIGFDFNNTHGAWLTMNRAMTKSPPGVRPNIAQDQLMALFAQIGVGPNQSLAAQSPSTLKALQQGAKTGLALLKAQSKSLGTSVNGWIYPPLSLGMAGQKEDYLVRAALQALGGITANWTVEAVYLNTSVDRDGAVLNSSTNYTISFSAENFPPFYASLYGFWSITLYDAETYQLLSGSNHFTVNSYAPRYQSRDADGGMTLYLQPNEPEAVDTPGSYWLQTSSDTSSSPRAFYLIMRVYMPQPAVSSTQTYVPPAVVKAT